VNKPKRVLSDQEKGRRAHESLSRILFGDLKSQDAESRIKALAGELSNLQLPEFKVHDIPDEYKGLMDEPGINWYERMQKACVDRDAEFFRDAADAVEYLRIGNRNRRSQVEFSHEVVKRTMTWTAFGMLNTWSKLPSLPQIIEATKNNYAWMKVIDLERSMMSPKEFEMASRSEDGIASRKAKQGEILRRMSDRKKGEIKWGQMVKELGLDILGPIQKGRPRKAMM
jgi:hypothetical protein